MAITRWVRLYCSDQMCNGGLWSDPRTFQESFDSGTNRPPFSVKFRGACGRKLAKAGPQFCGKFHRNSL